MKRLSILLGIAAGFVAPLAAHAEQTALIADTAVPQPKAKTSRVVVKAPAPTKAPRVRYEVTTMTAAGSHLPVVICHYDGAMYAKGGSFTPKKIYRKEGGAVDATGAANLQGGLSGIDPSFH